jgi:hypothetical protein
MNKPTTQQLAILAKHPDAALHFGGKRPVKKKSRPTVFFADGSTCLTSRTGLWLQGISDWEWQGLIEDNIIAYIPDPYYPHPPQAIPDELGAQGIIGGLWSDEPAKERPTRQQARDMLADAFESVDPDHNWAHIRSDEKADETTCVKAILDAIAGKE